jgi:hypothetical protein
VAFQRMIWLVSGMYQSSIDVELSVYNNGYHRTLADIDDRGKLNMAEFHVAMGLIYRSTYLYMRVV